MNENEIRNHFHKTSAQLKCSNLTLKVHSTAWEQNNNPYFKFNISFSVTFSQDLTIRVRYIVA